MNEQEAKYKICDCLAAFFYGFALPGLMLSGIFQRLSGSKWQDLKKKELG